MKKIVRLDLLAENQTAKVINNCDECSLNVLDGEEFDICVLGGTVDQSYLKQMEGFPKDCPLPDYVEKEGK